MGRLGKAGPWLPRSRRIGADVNRSDFPLADVPFGLVEGGTRLGRLAAAGRVRDQAAFFVALPERFGRGGEKGGVPGQGYCIFYLLDKNGCQ